MKVKYQQGRVRGSSYLQVEAQQFLHNGVQLAGGCGWTHGLTGPRWWFANAGCERDS